MSLPVEVTIPYVPNMSNNRRLAPSGGGGFRLSEKYRQAKAHAQGHVLVQSSGHRPTDEPVSVSLVCYWPDRRGRDVDGPIKLCVDSLIGYVIEDDAQVVRVEARRAGIDGENPRVEMRVESAEEES